MVDVYERGDVATLVVTWFEYQGGPGVDVDDLTVTVRPIAGGSPVLGPTGDDIDHITTGAYSYDWTVPDDLDVGEYLVDWDGTIAADAVQATEVIRIRAAGEWPPTLAELKDDMKIDADDIRDDDRLTSCLDASIAFVQRVKAGKFNFTGTDTDLETPDEDLRLGTMRLAGRWHTRRRSPDALVQMAELGATRVPSIDPDIDRMLRIGRFASIGFA